MKSITIFSVFLSLFLGVNVCVAPASAHNDCTGDRNSTSCSCPEIRHDEFVIAPCNATCYEPRSAQCSCNTSRNANECSCVQY